jgi:hypothetical protein
MSKRLDVSSLRALSKGLRELPVRAAQEIASKAAPELSKLADDAFASGKDAYGNPWVPGADGNAVTLEQSGRLRRALGFTSVGTILRSVLGVPYAKYIIGRWPILPRPKTLPASYSEALARVTGETCAAILQEGAPR